MKKFSSTMKASSRRSLRRKKRIKTTLVLVGLGFFLLYVTPSLVRGLVTVAVEPVMYVKSWIQNSQQGIPVFIRDRNMLLKDLESQQARILELEASASAVAYINATMSLAEDVRDNVTSRIAAGVLVDTKTSPYERFVLDKGSVDGVVVDAPVFVDAVHVIGVVAAVSDHQSIVRLLSSAGVESTVYVFGPDIYTTARGLGGGVLEVGVPQGIALSEGDVVVTPSLAGGSVGVISYIDSTPSRPEQYGYVTGPAALFQTHTVYIGTTALQPQSFADAQATVRDIRSRVEVVPVPDGILIDVNTATTTAATSTATPTTEIENIDE